MQEMGRAPETRQLRSKKHGILKRMRNGVVSTLENVFYKLGHSIGSRPWTAILCCTTVCGLTGIGLIRFTETAEPDTLWVPIGSMLAEQQIWISRNYPSAPRTATIIGTGTNVLTTTSLKAVYAIHESVENSISSEGIQLADVCLKIGDDCKVTSILELWSFNKTTIDTLTNQAIIDRVNTVKYSPMYGGPFDVKTILGGRRENATGHITEAKATMTSWLLRDDNTVQAKSQDLELEIIVIGLKSHEDLENTFVFTGRSFADEAGSAIQNDAILLSGGYFILIVFVAVVIGNFNLVEQRIGLTISSFLCIGLSILVSFGLASCVGSEYSPLHSVLPFLLIGIGVDDMFVIVASLNNLTPGERDAGLPETMGRALKQAGVSVTVTALTDMLVFAVGASTILPALRSFYIFAVFGIFGLYISQTVFFTACVALDVKRRETIRDACICCFRHANWSPNCFSKISLLKDYFRRVHGTVLSKFYVKMIVIILTLSIFAVNIYGVVKLKQNSDAIWYLSSESHAYKYLKTLEQYFPQDGADGYIYCPNIDYYSSQRQMNQLYTTVCSHPSTYNGTVDSWYEDYTRHMASGTSAADEASFIQSVFNWSHLESNRRILNDVKFTNNSGKAIDIVATRIAFQHNRCADSTAEVAAMDSMREMVSKILPDCFPYSTSYRTWETNKVIQNELRRNLGLAVVCVFVVTFILIANIITSFLVFTCVVFTLVNVCGVMYFWGLTIDTVTSIILIIAIGPAVDHATHIGYKFMTIRGSRAERMLKTLDEMGPAVFYGGFSTFLAFMLLALSRSYVFTTLFKVFLLVVVFGLFHGLVFLPVVLTLVGPPPYLNVEQDHSQDYTDVDTAETRISSNNSINSRRTGISVPTATVVPPEPPPDYAKPTGSSSQKTNGIGKRSGNHHHPKLVPPARHRTLTIPHPDYTPPVSPRTSTPRISI